MSQLPSQSPVQPSFSAQSLSIGAAGSVAPGMDNAILSLTHTPELAGSASYSIESGPQRKVTLLTRPQQPQPIAGMHTTSPLQQKLQNDVTGGSMAFMTSTGPVQGRAARDDYYDTEDPSVNLHEFIVNSMQAPKNRVILLRLEEEFFSYVADHTRMEPYKLPSWDSYHRMLAHRVAAYFGLEHNVDPMDKTRVIVCKGPNTRIPKRRFSDYMKVSEEVQSTEPKLILKRSPKEVSKLEQLDAAVSSSVNASEVKGLKSFEEREEEYEKARARIFNQQPSMQNTRTTIAFDLATRTTQRTSSLFTSMMHHRRAASDTAMFNRPLAADFKKEGTSSNHSSRSTTPLVSLLSRPSCPEMSSQPLPSHSSPQKSPPHQSQQNLQNTSSPLQEQSYSLQMSSVYSPPAKPKQQQSTSFTSSASSPAVQFQPVQAPLPMMYSQQTPVVDPGWYYQQMMLYQMSPQNCIARPQYAAGVQPFIHPGTVFSRYAVTAGVVGQPGLVSPTVASGGSPQVSPARMPLGVDLPSPPHPASGVLVRPIPQQPSSLRLTGKLESPWNSPHFAPTIMAQQYPVSPQSNQTAFTTLVPLTPPGTILAEQMKALNLSESTSGSVGEKSVTPSNPRMLKHNEGENILTNFPEGPVSKHSPGNGYPMPLNGNEQGIVGGHFNPHGAVHFISPQQPVYGNGQEGSFLSGASMIPNATGGLLQYSSTIPHAQTPTQPPSTPPVGAFALAPPGVVHAQQQQGIFSPTSTGIQSPVQILGHTLGTSLFSPPPSSTSPHGIFVNSPSTAGKMAFSPVFPAVGSGPVQQSSMSEGNMAQQKPIFGKETMNGNGSVSMQLPPRLAQHRFSGNRYQNQRHPSNKFATKPNVTQSSSSVEDNVSTTASQISSTISNSTKREPLLPTPPSNQMVKLDTSLTCGVPVNVMEIVRFPLEGTPENHKAIEALYELGAKDFKSGRMVKCGENVMIVIFDTPESAVKALQSKHPLFSLSIPRNNHSKFIMTLL